MQKLKELFMDKTKLNYFVLAVIITVYLFSFFIPEIKKLLSELTRCAQVKRRILGIEKEWANIDSFKEKIARLNKEIDHYEKKLPGEKEIPAVLKYLSVSAKKLNVKITGIKPVGQNQDKEQIYYSVPILVKAKCGYHQLGRFINELEKTDRFMKISNINIKGKPYQDNSLNIQLSVVTYVMSKK